MFQQKYSLPRREPARIIGKVLKLSLDVILCGILVQIGEARELETLLLAL